MEHSGNLDVYLLSLYCIKYLNKLTMHSWCESTLSLEKITSRESIGHSLVTLRLGGRYVMVDNWLKNQSNFDLDIDVNWMILSWYNQGIYDGDTLK